MKRMDRREMLETCLVRGLLLAPGLAYAAAVDAWAAQNQRAPTPADQLGPFYKRNAPESTRLVPQGEPGFPIQVMGRVVNTRGDVLPNAVVEVWHADRGGRYDLEGYNCRGRLRTDENGEYAFFSVMPGHYPQRAAQHIHFIVRADGHTPLVTQMYFATDPVFRGDPGRNFSVEPMLESAELIRPVSLAGNPPVLARMAFEICVDRM